MKKPKYGIQGGVGSFNEEALLNYFSKNNKKEFEIIYLYTTENVLSALNKKEIDYGFFAYFNSLGSVVWESAEAMGNYNFSPVSIETLKIQHFLMKHKNTAVESLTAVMAHPQVLVQCAKNLTTKYPRLQRKIGEGDLMDTANAAKALANGEISVDTAILGPKCLSELYNLEIIEGNLQDLDENYTTFLLVSP